MRHGHRCIFLLFIIRAYLYRACGLFVLKTLAAAVEALLSGSLIYTCRLLEEGLIYIRRCVEVRSGLHMMMTHFFFSVNADSILRSDVQIGHFGEAHSSIVQVAMI